MSRLVWLFIVLAGLCIPGGTVVAQPSSGGHAAELAPLLQQNHLIAEVAREDPDSLWNLVSKISVLVTNPRAGGPARSGTAPTASELAEIDANPALRLAYERDPAATLALIQATHAGLQGVHLRGQDQPRRVAMVVGSDGGGAWGPLATTRNDAVLMAQVLQQQGFEIAGGAALIDPDKAHLLQAIRQFAHRIGPETVAFFYYAGHGVQANGRNFIVPAHAATPRVQDDYDRSLVDVDDAVLREMQQAGGRLNIVVLDACRDHPILPAQKSAGGTDGRLGRGLAPMGAPASSSGTIILYSTGPNSIADDGSRGAMDSPFATALVAAIGEGGEIRDVFDRVQVAVDRESHHAQQPWISYSTGDKFYFDVASVSGLAGGTADDSGAPCPRPGTTVTLSIAGQRTTGTYQPAAPSAADVCDIKSPLGETHLLYNLYDIDHVIDWSPVRAALKELLSGHTTKVEFEVRWRTTFPFPSPRETWTRLGRDSVVVDGQPIGAIVLDRDLQGLPGWSSADHHREWKIWYSPAQGVIKQVELTADQAQAASTQGNISVTAVTPY
jgi:hypothetical protein